MKHKLKVGDYVKVIDNLLSSFQMGEKGTITKVEAGYVNIRLDRTKLNHSGWLMSRFKKCDNKITDWKERIK